MSLLKDRIEEKIYWYTRSLDEVPRLVEKIPNACNRPNSPWVHGLDPFPTFRQHILDLYYMIGYVKEKITP